MINNIPLFVELPISLCIAQAYLFLMCWQITVPKSAFAYGYTLAKSTGKKPTQNN
jgi:hypothetical protein